MLYIIIIIIMIYLNAVQHVKLWHRRRQCENIYGGAALRQKQASLRCVRYNVTCSLQIKTQKTSQLAMCSYNV